MISVSNLSVGFGGSYLYEDISFIVNMKDRIGLAGKNGAGKSTLLKILAGEQHPDKGQVSKQADCTLGYLPQDMKHNLGKTVFDETSTAFKEVKSLEKRIQDITHQLESRTDYESDAYMDLITQLNDSNDRFSLLGGYTMQADIELILLGLGFERKEFTRLTNEFSGGWRMRIELAKILLQKPSVILLDEPTNHLDIESIEWLEEFLKNYYGAVVVVSHDKAFLDNLTTRTLEISTGKIYDYKANYSKYQELRKERKEQQVSEAKNQEKYIEHTKELINKFRAKKNKAAFAQSLIKKLDKLEIVEVDDEDSSSIRFNFPPAPRSGKVVVEASKLKKQFDEKVIFSDVDFFIERQERIAFVGKNGEGKSTLSRMIVGQDKKYEGVLNLGHNVAIGYFAQNQSELLDPEKTVFQTIDDIAVGDIRKNVRSLLGSFLFSGDSIDKKVKVLSGGEKSRLAMCQLLLQPYNLLVLDEPTNHLDIRSKEVLKNALIRYDGTLIIVSHDRDFLQGLANKVFEFRNKNIKPFIGGVYEFLETRKLNTLSDLEAQVKVIKEKEKSTLSESKVVFEQRKEAEKEQKRIQGQIKKIEEEIAKLEKEIKEFDDNLLDPEKCQQILNDKNQFANYERLKKQHQDEMDKWEALNLELEKLGV